MYSFNLPDTSGQAGAYVFWALFNPADSGVDVVVTRLQVTPFAVATTVAPQSPLINRVNSVNSGGTLTYDPASPSATVNKLDTDDPDAKVEVWIDNPSVSTSSAIARIAPPVQGVTPGTLGAVTQEKVFDPRIWGSRLVLHQGQGICFRQTGGNANERWVSDISWAEFLAAS